MPPKVLLAAQPETYDQQIGEKRKRIETMFAKFDPPQLEVYESERQNYRMRSVCFCKANWAASALLEVDSEVHLNRSEFRVWHEGNQCHYIMFDKVCNLPYTLQAQYLAACDRSTVTSLCNDCFVTQKAVLTLKCPCPYSEGKAAIRMQ